MNQDLIDAYKKLDAIKEFECDNNISTILALLDKWNKKAQDNKELKKVIEAFLDIQWHIIELKRDRDLALKAVMQYKFQRDGAVNERNEAKQQLKKYEDTHLD
jgi:tRNA A37 threonylcarbamoyladenosine synthetase subunit TsaC/SUA5/YrdC|tara:strand:+ start:3760 stop:4068 length:309 start_codon:yes stop_codon:yes gene_type:complete